MDMFEKKVLTALAKFISEDVITDNQNTKTENEEMIVYK